MTSSSDTLTTHDGLRLHVTARGRAEAPVSVLLAHCWTADEEDWHYQVLDLLTRYGHDVRVITWDHRGHGKSDPSPAAACTVANVARDLGAVVDAFAPTGRLVVAGHSLGGFGLSAIPEERPDLIERIAGLMFVSTSSGELDTVTLGLPARPGKLLDHQIPVVLANRAKLLSVSRRQRQPIIERQITRRVLFGDVQRPRDVGLVVDQIINCPPATMSGFFQDFMKHERAASLAAFDGIPTVVLVGTHDLLTPPAHSSRIVRSIQGARLLVAPGAGHYLPLERHDLVTAELCALVDRALVGRGTTPQPRGAAPDSAGAAAPSLSAS